MSKRTKDETIRLLRTALTAMLEVCDEPCWFDHHGLCQAHNLRANDAGEPECQVELAREALRLTTKHGKEAKS